MMMMMMMMMLLLLLKVFYSMRVEMSVVLHNVVLRCCFSPEAALDFGPQCGSPTQATDRNRKF
jgi:hypothetical protein